jgi:single-strand DNA-binding protein
MNKCFLLGRLGADAELKMTQGGKAILKFSLATSEKWTNANGEKQEKTEWHRCQMWGDRGTKLAQYLTKGKQIAVEGSISYGSYEKDNVKHYTTDIKVLNIEFAGDSKGGNASSSSSDAAGDDDPLAPSGIVGDDDLPF